MAGWAPLTLIGTILGQAATREIAADIAAGGNGKALQRAAIWLCGCASAVSAAVFMLCGPYFLNWLDASAANLEQWRANVIALAPGWFAQQILIVMNGLASARQDFRLVAYFSLVTAGSSLLATLFITSQWPTSTGYLWGVSASFIAAVCGCAWLVRSLAFAEAPSDHYSFKSGAVALLRFGRWQSVSHLVGTLSNQIDRYMLASLASPVLIGQFNAANRLQEAAYLLVVKAGEVLFPRFGATSTDRVDKRLKLFLLGSWAVTSLGGLVLGPVIILAEPLMRLWAGEETAQGGALLLQVLTLGGLIGLGSNVFTYYLMGIGQTGILAAIATAYSVLTIMLSIMALLIFGPLAAGVGLVIASALRVALAMFWCQFKTFPTATWADLFGSTVVPLLASIGLAVPLAILAPVESIRTWWQLILAFPPAVILVAATLSLTNSTTRFGRDALFSMQRYFTPVGSRKR